jgi:hypothetical protein
MTSRRLLLLSLILGACADTGTTIGPLGGRVESDDGSGWLEIPEGALANATVVTFEARVADRRGFVSDRTWSISFGGETLSRPATVSLPCEACSGFERLGVRGQVGVIPRAEGSGLVEDRFVAAIGHEGVFGVTTCAHRYCLEGRVTGSELRLTWEGEGATVDGASSPVVETVTLGGPNRRYTVAGPDGYDELVAVLDPLAPPAGLRTMAAPRGGIRLLWEPSLFAGILFDVERRVCERVVGRLGGRLSGVTDRLVVPGVAYSYAVGQGDGPRAEVEARAEAGACVVEPAVCELDLAAGVTSDVAIAIEPALSSGQYRVRLGEESQSLAGFATARLSPARTAGATAASVTGMAGAEGERLVWIEASVSESQTCRAPLWLRAAD